VGTGGDARAVATEAAFCGNCALTFLWLCVDRLHVVESQASSECCVIPHASTADMQASLFECGLAILYTWPSGGILPATVVSASSLHTAVFFSLQSLSHNSQSPNQGTKCNHSGPSRALQNHAAPPVGTVFIPHWNWLCYPQAQIRPNPHSAPGTDQDHWVWADEGASGEDDDNDELC
jgi:hypothetical protein